VSHRAIQAVCVVALVTSGALAACGKKKPAGPPPEVTGLAAVPASAQVVLVGDVGKIVDAPLVSRAVDQLLGRDADLAARWQKLRDTCKLDASQIHHAALAIGPTPTGQRAGTGPVLLVATGKLVEADLATCVRGMVGQGGGSLTAKDNGGRTLYQAKDGNRTLFFAFTRADTVVLGANEAFVLEAIGTGAKIPDNPEMTKWLGLAEQKSPLWGAGRVDERVRAGLLRVTAGKLTAGPSAIVLAIDPTSGARIELTAVMASSADAKALESFAQKQLGLIAMAAQAKGLGKLVDKIEVAATDTAVRFRLALDVDQVNQLISALDGGGADKQDSPPPAGSGSAGSAQ